MRSGVGRSLLAAFAVAGGAGIAITVDLGAIRTPADAELASSLSSIPVRTDAVPAHLPVPVDVTQVIDVKRSGSILWMTLKNSPLPDAIQALARATHSQVHGMEYLGAGDPKISMDWHGTSASSAWIALLAGLSNTAIRCSGWSCQVVLIGGVAPATQAAVHTAPTSGADKKSEPAPQSQTVSPRPPAEEPFYGGTQTSDSDAT